MTTATSPKPAGRPQALGKASDRGLTPRMLNHLAYVTHDVAATADFYTRILGMELASTIFDDQVPSTGENFPYFHIFFRMADGSYIAFFDLGDGKATTPDPETPAWVNHIALELGSVEELTEAKRRLEEHGIAVLGPTDHGILRSIYFFDPNGLRVELTCWTVSAEHMAEAARSAHSALADWRQRARPA